MTKIKNYLRLRETQKEARRKSEELMRLCGKSPELAKSALNNGAGERLARQLNTLAVAIQELKNKSLIIKLMSKLGI
jgi:hypothetical protein